MKLTLTIEPEASDYWLDTVRAVTLLCNQVSCVRVDIQDHAGCQIGNRLRAMGFAVEEFDGGTDAPLAELPSSGADAPGGGIADQRGNGTGRPDGVATTVQP